jgi:hypothetical protein
MHLGIDSLVWVVGLSVLLTLIGFISARGLPPKRRNLRIRRFAAAGGALVFLALPLCKPHIVSYSSIEFDEPVASLPTSSSLDAVTKHIQEQDRAIERLRKEAIKAREDLYEVDFYYSTVAQLFSILGAITFFNLALSSRVFLFGKVEDPESNVEDYKIFEQSEK